MAFTIGLSPGLSGILSSFEWHLQKNFVNFGRLQNTFVYLSICKFEQWELYGIRGKYTTICKGWIYSGNLQKNICKPHSKFHEMPDKPGDNAFVNVDLQSILVIL